MDPKASAKSKRTHSYQGRRSHPTPSAIAQKKKPAAAPAAGGAPEKSRPRARDLPSNWDRYDSGEEEPESSTGVQTPDGGGVAPKSKGADFGYLVEQARLQPRENPDLGSQCSGELCFDFMQGVSSILSVRGKSLLSWCQDDNFIVDEEPTSGSEVPFLSMDLHALAAQLSKLKLSQRLFIESDLLPEELNADISREHKISEQSETSVPSKIKQNVDAPGVLCNADLEKNADGLNGIDNSYMDHGIIHGAVAEKHKISTSKVYATTLEHPEDPKRVDHFISTEAQSSMPQTSMHTIPDSKQDRTSRFEAMSAEAELDMLLNSFSEASLSSSIAEGPITNSSTVHGATSGLLELMDSPSASQDHNSSNNAGSTSFDIDIDDLLAETTSGQVAGAASLGDAIDDLLAETSVSLKDQKQVANLNKQGTVSSANLPARSPLGSKPSEDFDSCDTI